MLIFVYKMIFWPYNKIEHKDCYQRFRPDDKNPGGFSFGIVRAVMFLIEKLFPNFKHIKFTKDCPFYKIIASMITAFPFSEYCPIKIIRNLQINIRFGGIVKYFIGCSFVNILPWFKKPFYGFFNIFSMFIDRDRIRDNINVLKFSFMSF